ncbi:MAG: hypothetical protein AB7S38_29580 [Vulcanimicrobiota bacterium]
MQKCPKCDHKMEPGFVIDFSRTAVRQSVWHPGNPTPAEDKVFGINLAPEDAIEFDAEACKPVVTWRCLECGYLEFYGY